MAGIGGPRRNKHSETHGIVTLKNQIRRRVRKGRSFIDRRSHTGRNALEAQAGLIADLGGMENVSTAERIMVEMVSRDLYLLDEIDRRIQHVCKKMPQGKNNPKFLALLYSYRMPVVSAISRNLTALGLQRKEIAPRSLEDIFNEPAGDTDTDEE